jgi:hypothetical protein
MDNQSLVCTSNEFIYCPSLPASHSYEVVVDGKSGATGSFGINVVTGAAKGANSYGIVTVSPPRAFSSIASDASVQHLIDNSNIENATKTIQLPFAVPFFGLTHTAGEDITVYQSGYIGFGSTAVNTLYNQCLPAASLTTLPAETISPMWGRLESRPGVRGDVWSEVVGSAPNRQLIVEWEHMDAGDVPDTGYECISTSVQVILDEASGTIEFRYNPDSEDRCTGTSADQNYAVGGHSTIGLLSHGAPPVLVEQVACNTANGLGPAQIGTCTRPGGNAISPCTANKGYVFVPVSTGCP